MVEGRPAHRQRWDRTIRLDREEGFITPDAVVGITCQTPGVDVPGDKAIIVDDIQNAIISMVRTDIKDLIYLVFLTT